jgi:hypothetical protein
LTARILAPTRVAFFPGGAPRRLLQLPWPATRDESGRNCERRREAQRLLWRPVMRPRTIISDVQQESTPVRSSSPMAERDTYERVRETLNEALAELQLPMLDRDDSGVITLPRRQSISR